MKAKLIVCLILLGLAVVPVSLYAQRAEVHPYAGGFWPTKHETLGKFQSDGVYGVKAGMFVGPKFELGGNVGYINHFEPSSSNDISIQNAALGIQNNPIRAWIWEGTADYNFTTRNFMDRAITPYVTIGLGGVTTSIDGGDSAVFVGGLTAHDDEIVPRPTTVVEDNDTFFAISYGGGVKALQLWGPMGLRADVRGRTMPNFFSEPKTWPEVTGGLTFSWGER